MSDTFNNPKTIMKIASVLILFIGYWLCNGALVFLLGMILTIIQTQSAVNTTGILTNTAIIIIMFLIGFTIIYFGTTMWQKWPIVLNVIAFIMALSGIGSSILMYFYRTYISGQSNQVTWTAVTESFLIMGIINLVIGFTLLLLIRRKKLVHKNFSTTSC